MMEMTPSKPDAVLDGQETPKMSSNTPVMEEQVLSWLIELLTLQGAVGLFTDWLPEHFLSMFTIDVDAFGAFTDFRADGPDLQTCLELGNRAYSRELWLVQVTAQNRSLYPRVLALVESRLLARGIPRERLGGLTHRQKLIMYAEMDLPRAPPQASFTLYLVMAKDAQGSTRESAKLFFPYTTTFARFQGILRDFTAYSAIQTGRTGGYTLRDGPWIYQLVGPNKAIIPGLPKYSIADEADFRMMKKQLQNKDSPSACIFHSLVARLFEERADSYNANVDEEESALAPEDDVETVVDENGEPYFERQIDWKDIIQRVNVSGLKSVTGGQ